MRINQSISSYKYIPQILNVNPFTQEVDDLYKDWFESTLYSNSAELNEDYLKIKNIILMQSNIASLNELQKCEDLEEI